jgi:hypothetical protein
MDDSVVVGVVIIDRSGMSVAFPIEGIKFEWLNRWEEIWSIDGDYETNRSLISDAGITNRMQKSDEIEK